MKIGASAVAVGAFVGGFAILACSDSTDQVEPHADGGHAGECPHVEHEWTYEESEAIGPSHWGDVKGDDGKPSWPLCGSTTDQQSPINLPLAGLPSGTFGLGANELTWSTNAAVNGVINNGHTWLASFTGDQNRLAVGTDVYNLKQFHFHAPSEHHIDGKEYPLEIHFVHVHPSASPDGSPGATAFAAVVGVMFEVGPENAELAKVWPKFSKCMQEKEDVLSGVSLDLPALLPANRTYVTYDGSLTTPPCSVVVRFHLLKDTIKASQKQIDELTAAVGPNNRPIQTTLGSTTVTLHPHSP